MLEKERLIEAVILNIKAARNHPSTIIDKLGPRSEQEIIELLPKALGIFANIQAIDILKAYEIRKDVLTKLIPTYTSDVAQSHPIIEELDALFFIARATGRNYIRNSINE